MTRRSVNSKNNIEPQLNSNEKFQKLQENELKKMKQKKEMQKEQKKSMIKTEQEQEKSNTVNIQTDKTIKTSKTQKIKHQIDDQEPKIKKIQHIPIKNFKDFQYPVNDSISELLEILNLKQNQQYFSQNLNIFPVKQVKNRRIKIANQVDQNHFTIQNATVITQHHMNESSAINVEYLRNNSSYQTHQINKNNANIFIIQDFLLMSKDEEIFHHLIYQDQDIYWPVALMQNYCNDNVLLKNNSSILILDEEDQFQQKQEFATNLFNHNFYDDDQEYEESPFDNQIDSTDYQQILQNIKQENFILLQKSTNYQQSKQDNLMNSNKNIKLFPKNQNVLVWFVGTSLYKIVRLNQLVKPQDLNEQKIQQLYSFNRITKNIFSQYVQLIKQCNEAILNNKNFSFNKRNQFKCFYRLGFFQKNDQKNVGIILNFKQLKGKFYVYLKNILTFQTKWIEVDIDKQTQLCIDFNYPGFSNIQMNSIFRQFNSSLECKSSKQKTQFLLQELFHDFLYQSIESKEIQNQIQKHDQKCIVCHYLIGQLDSFNCFNCKKYCHTACSLKLTVKDKDFWFCGSCEICTICFEPFLNQNTEINCLNCNVKYHRKCLHPLPNELGLSWFCNDCSICCICNNSINIIQDEYRLLENQPVCINCHIQLENKEFCGICGKNYHFSDQQNKIVMSEWIYCEDCSTWIHRKCDPILDAVLFREFSQSKKIYSCPHCRAQLKNIFLADFIKIMSIIDLNQFFQHPVDAKIIPQYYNVIQHPMDFSTMIQKAQQGLYISDPALLIKKDFDLIFDNAMKFNFPKDIIFKDAYKFQLLFRCGFEYFKDLLRDSADTIQKNPKKYDPKLIQEPFLEMIDTYFYDIIFDEENKGNKSHNKNVRILQTIEAQQNNKLISKDLHLEIFGLTNQLLEIINQNNSQQNVMFIEDQGDSVKQEQHLFEIVKITKSQLQKTFYENLKNQTLNDFLVKSIIQKNDSFQVVQPFVIFSQKYPLQNLNLCYICGSNSQHHLQCALCHESFHTYCLNIDPNANIKESWTCPQCSNCKICNQQDDSNIIYCNVCNDMFHLACAFQSESMQSLPLNLWKCKICFNCKTCDSTDFFNNITDLDHLIFDIEINFEQCYLCTFLNAFTQFCKICEKYIIHSDSNNSQYQSLNHQHEDSFQCVECKQSFHQLCFQNDYPNIETNQNNFLCFDCQYYTRHNEIQDIQLSNRLSKYAIETNKKFKEIKIYLNAIKSLLYGQPDLDTLVIIKFINHNWKFIANSELTDYLHSLSIFEQIEERLDQFLESKQVQNSETQFNQNQGLNYIFVSQHSVKFQNTKLQSQLINILNKYTKFDYKLEWFKYCTNNIHQIYQLLNDQMIDYQSNRHINNNESMIDDSITVNSSNLNVINSKQDSYNIEQESQIFQDEDNLIITQQIQKSNKDPDNSNKEQQQTIKNEDQKIYTIYQTQFDDFEICDWDSVHNLQNIQLQIYELTLYDQMQQISILNDIENYIFLDYTTKNSILVKNISQKVKNYKNLWPQAHQNPQLTSYLEKYYLFLTNEKKIKQKISNLYNEFLQNGLSNTKSQYQQQQKQQQQEQQNIQQDDVNKQQQQLSNNIKTQQQKKQLDYCYKDEQQQQIQDELIQDKMEIEGKFKINKKIILSIFLLLIYHIDLQNSFNIIFIYFLIIKEQDFSIDIQIYLFQGENVNQMIKNLPILQNIQLNNGFEHIPCALCHEFGEKSISGRLIYSDIDVWIHSNCIQFSDQVEEIKIGAFLNFNIQNYFQNKCSHCDKKNASLICSKRCGKIFHFPCAIANQSFFLYNKTIICKQCALECNLDVSKTINDFGCERKFFLPPVYNLQQKYQTNEKLQLKIGNLTIIGSQYDQQKQNLNSVVLMKLFGEQIIVFCLKNDFGFLMQVDKYQNQKQIQNIITDVCRQYADHQKELKTELIDQIIQIQNRKEDIKLEDCKNQENLKCESFQDNDSQQIDLNISQKIVQIDTPSNIISNQDQKNEYQLQIIQKQNQIIELQDQQINQLQQNDSIKLQIEQNVSQSYENQNQINLSEIKSHQMILENFNDDQNNYIQYQNQKIKILYNPYQLLNQIDQKLFNNQIFDQILSTNQYISPQPVQYLRNIFQLNEIQVKDWIKYQRRIQNKQYNNEKSMNDFFYTQNFEECNPFQRQNAVEKNYNRLQQNDQFILIVNQDQTQKIDYNFKMFEENTKQQEGKITENKRQIDFNFIFNEKQEDIDRPVEHLKKFQMEKYKSSYYKYKKARVKKAYVGPSKIHKYGIFAKQFIQKEEIVTEYLGEIIRNEVADRREIYYTQMGFGDCYLFRVDLNYVIDATFKGNEARYLNHSCDPNCASVIVDLDGFKSIVFFAKRNISIGEEITYDYQFESEEQKLKCTCGSKFCQGSLN